VDMVMIYLVDEDRKEAILQAHRNMPEDYIRRAGRIPYPKGITWKVIESGEIMNVEDAQKDPNIGPAGRDLGHHGLLGIPITLEGVIIGVIWFLSYKERRFDKQEVDLLSSIGNQIAVAIAKAKLYKDLSKKNRHEAITNTVTRSVHQSINLQEVLENTVESMSKNIDEAEVVSIYLVEGEEAVLRAHSGYPDQYIKGAGRIPYPKGVTWKTIIEEEPIYCADVDQDTIIGPAGREMGIKSYLCMPIRFEGKTVGTLNITSFRKNAFDEEEIKLLEIIAQQIEVAINNAKQAEALRQSEEELRSSREQLRNLAAHVQSVREEERTRIAREIHDELGQALTGLKMGLSWLDKKLSEVGNVVPRPLLEQITSMSKLVDTTIQTVREISTELRPGVLDDLGLTAAIEWQAQEFQTQTGIRCKFTSSPENITLDQDRSTAIFRIFQETLTNVARHANATRVNVRLKEKADDLILKVRDNGKGITESEISNPKSLGLLGMRERALLFGGEVKISGIQGKGATITVRIPLKR